MSKADNLRECFARFFSLLAAMLVAMSLYYGIESIIISRPIITAIDAPFKICPGFEVVKPGNVVCYQMHYFKRLDMPGELTKQLIVKSKDGRNVYLPLEYLSGHLPPGDVEGQAYAEIPLWAPEGEARIKLSSAHFTGRIRQFTTVYTQTFLIKR